MHPRAAYEGNALYFFIHGQRNSRPYATHLGDGRRLTNSFLRHSNKRTLTHLHVPFRSAEHFRAKVTSLAQSYFNLPRRRHDQPALRARRFVGATFKFSRVGHNFFMAQRRKSDWPETHGYDAIAMNNVKTRRRSLFSPSLTRRTRGNPVKLPSFGSTDPPPVIHGQRNITAVVGSSPSPFVQATDQYDLSMVQERHLIGRANPT